MFRMKHSLYNTLHLDKSTKLIIEVGRTVIGGGILNFGIEGSEG